MKLSVVDGFSITKDAFVSFNVQSYSERRTSCEQAEYKWGLQQSNNLSHFIALNDDKIIGQIILFPAECYYQGKAVPCVFAYDYIVTPEYLNTGVGVKLLHKTLKSYTHFGIGLSEISRKLHLALKENSVGNIHKYVFTKNILSFVFAGVKTYLKKDIRKIPTKLNWPDKILHNSNAVESVAAIPKHENWNNDLIEFGRSQSFSSLRFNSVSPNYKIYQIADVAGMLLGYFVLRVELWRGMRVLIVADYRFKIGNEQAFNLMMHASKLLMNKNKLDAILFGSSLQWLDNHLLKNGFKKVGLPSEIVTNLPLESNWESKAEARNLIFATPADSDFEFNLGNELWKRN